MVSRSDDPPNHDDLSCAVCGLWAGGCICPECPHCGDIGNPGCYVDTVDRKLPNHGLVRTAVQKESMAEAEKQWEADSESDWEQAHRYKQELEDGLGMSFDTGLTDAEIDRAQRHLEWLFGKEWLEGKE